MDINVRLAAYRRLSNLAEYLQVFIKEILQFILFNNLFFQISQKRQILHCGFLDSSDKVVDFITISVIPKWLDHYRGNILLLMKSVRLDADEKDIEETLMLFEYILRIFFK